MCCKIRGRQNVGEKLRIEVLSSEQGNIPCDKLRFDREMALHKNKANYH